MPPVTRSAASGSDGRRSAAKGVVKKKTKANATSGARKYLTDLNDLISGKISAIATRLEDWAPELREDVTRIAERIKTEQREKAFGVYEEACFAQDHVCHICFEARYPQPASELRSTEFACSHVGDYHLSCLMRSSAHVRLADTFDRGVSLFRDKDSSQTISIAPSILDYGFARAVLFCITCPTCRTVSKIPLPQYASYEADNYILSIVFERQSRLPDICDEDDSEDDDMISAGDSDDSEVVIHQPAHPIVIE
jgi:hypothetical protein